MDEDFKILRIKFIPTDFECVVIYSKFKDDIVKYLEDNYKYCDEDNPLVTSGVDTLRNRNGAREIVMELQTLSYGVILHECIHAVYHWAACIGLKFDADNNEMLAYWAEYLFNEIVNWSSNKTE
jgi:hypothetical protein